MTVAGGLVWLLTTVGAGLGLVAWVLQRFTVGALRRAVVRFQLPTEPTGRLHWFGHDALAQNPDIAYRFGAYEVPPGHVGVLRSARHPDAAFFSLVVYDRLMQSRVPRPDGGPTHRDDTRLTTDPEGRFVAVLARHDPGHPNWLDITGASSGVVCERHLGASPVGEATLEIVAEADFAARFP